MANPTKFKKIAAGGLNQGDASLNRFGIVPIIQKSQTVSAGITVADGGSHIRIGVCPEDGANLLDILTIVEDDVSTDDGVILKYGTSADASAFGVIVVSGYGRYTLPHRNAAQVGAGVVQSSAYSVTAGTHIIVEPSTADATFVTFTTFLQNQTTDF